MPRDRGKIDSLTGVRAIAAFLVLLYHTPRQDFLPAPLQSLMGAGHMGVTLFFVLSGFVLAWNYGGRFAGGVTRAALFDFALARIARIYPVYLGLLLIAYHSKLFGDKLSLSTKLTNLFLLQSWHPDWAVVTAMSSISWTLSVELFCYLCLPFLLAGLFRPGLGTRAILARLVPVVMAMTLLAGWTGWLRPDLADYLANRLPLARLGDFMLGIAMAQLARQPLPPRLCCWLAPAGGGLIMLFLLMDSSIPQAMLPASFRHDLLYALPAAALFLGLAVAPARMPARVLGSPVFRWLGEISFSFYMVHSVTMSVLQLHDAAPRLSTGDYLMAVATAWGTTLILAMIAFYAIERPGRALVLQLNPLRAATRSKTPPPPARQSQATDSSAAVPADTIR